MSLSKIKSRRKLRHYGALFYLGLFLAFQLPLASAQSVTRGYGSDQVLQRGMIVGVTKSSADKVEAIDVNHISQILGVVVSSNDAPITVSSDNQHIFVATSGRYDVLVSDQQGAINNSDYITLSSLSGVGMKANENQPSILGRAASSFDGKTNVLSTTVLNDTKGAKITVHISRIPVEISVTRNPLARKSDNTPAFLGQAGRAIAGKSVSAIRLYLSALIFLAGTIIAGSIMYAGIRGSIISIGRNPLSKQSIFRSLFGVALTGFIVFLISAIGVYLILKL